MYLEGSVVKRSQKLVNVVCKRPPTKIRCGGQIMPTTILLASSLIFRSPYGPALKICLLISVTTYVINIYKESEKKKMLIIRIRLCIRNGLINLLVTFGHHFIETFDRLFYTAESTYHLFTHCLLKLLS